MLRIIQSRLNESDLIEELLTHFPDSVGECSGQLFQRVPGGQVILRPDQVHDSFCLGQIDAAVQKGPLGEFSRLRRPCSLLENQPEDFLEHEDSPVTVDLNHIFPGICPGRPKDRDKNLVHPAGLRCERILYIRIYDISIGDTVALHFAESSLPAEDRIRDGDRVRT